MDYQDTFGEQEEEDFPGRLLHQAALWDNAELLEDLLRGEQLAYINSQDAWGRTPLHAAATTENSKCLRVLLQSGANPNTACGTRGEAKVTSICVLENEIYIGTTWGCIVVAERESMRPITVFRPFQEEVCSILALPVKVDGRTCLATVGRGYRSLINRYKINLEMPLQKRHC
ncbi:uncharacterized protein LOC135835253 isoform X2 [Planococcus citri]|uniref:uncharacterized protein LOC135835253 isoform X2 n=1 Tax=Planococcus citri TaxID=170843 RepID=UPI0031F88FFD